MNDYHHAIANWQRYPLILCIKINDCEYIQTFLSCANVNVHCAAKNAFTDFVQGYPQRKRLQRRPETLLIWWFQGWIKSSALIKVVLCLIYWFNKESNKSGNHECTEKQYKFLKVVSEVSSFVGNPVYEKWKQSLTEELRLSSN